MCGRYAASRSPDDLVEEFEIIDPGAVERARALHVEPDWNVAPTKTSLVVLSRPPSEDREAPPVRQIRPLVWGLVPSWAKDRSVGAKMINARAESVLEKPAYRRAITSRRCLVPADGWYEWQASPVAKDAKGRPRKQPFFVTSAGGGGLALAGVYEFWRDGSRDPEDPLAWLTTFAVVTTDAAGGLDRVHDRMPLALPRDRWDAWLSPEVTDPDEVRALLSPPPGEAFTAYPVSTRVNDVRNSSPDLVEPLPVTELVGVVDPMTGELLGDAGDVLFT